jgi:replicative DNA helicase
MQGDRFANRENLVSAISRAMKTLAMDLNLPVTAVSQLNREVERRSVKEPQLADLRESGSLEQDADTIVFLYRPEYYYGEKTEEDLKGKCKFIVAKQRSGKTAAMWMYFTAECTRFTNLEPGKYDDLCDGIDPG